MKKLVKVLGVWCLVFGAGVADAGDFDAEGNGNPLVVTTSEDVVDPDDGLVSLREAIAYGLDHCTECASRGFITPEFSASAFKDGDVRLVLNRAITLDMCEAFEKGCTVWIKPGVGQRLTLSTDPLCGGGLFRQAEGTRLRFDDVLFADCSNFEGSGGVLDSDGRTRFNCCRFENCFAGGVKLVTAAHALESAFAPINELIGLSNVVYGTVLRSIPPVRREQFVKMDGMLSDALKVCVQTVEIVRNIDIPFEQRLDDSYACMTNFVRSTEGAADAFNVFRLYAPTIAMRLNAEGIYVNEREFMASLDAAWASMNEFTALRNEFTDANAVAAMGSGGAIHLGPKAECIVYDASARGCSAFGDGGFLQNEGDFKGVNLTLTGNNAIEGGCICNLAGTNQLASVAIVDNVSEINGAVSVRGGAIGLLNSIVIANKGGSVAFAKDVTVTKNVYSLVEGDTPIAKSDVFASTVALEGSVSNHLAQLYYPLKPNGLATCTGTFVFFNADTLKMDADGLDSEWISGVLHTTDPDGFTPKPQWLFGSGGPRLNASLLYDLLGQPIRTWENPETFGDPVPASMGPVPNVPPEAAGLIVTTFDDVVSTVDNKTSLREAAAYAMDMSTDKVVSVGFELDGTYTLKNQIVVPSGRTLRISATRGRVTLKPATTLGNRFFRVERGGRLELNGLTLDGGYAKGDYDVGMRPTNDDDGGAICSEGTLVLTDCTVQNCKANGYGGAVWSGGGMTATRCTFTENFAQRGGGICSCDEPLRLSDVSITDNIAQGYGGGLYLVTGSNDVIATGMTITGNNAKGETVTAGPNRGGGVYLTANLAANPGTVTISGTVADNTGGNDSRDGGTEPESPVHTSETSDRGGVPPQPTPHSMPESPRLMSAVNALAATPVLGVASETVIDTSGTKDILVLDGDFTASKQVRITGGAVLTLTGASPSKGTVEVKNRSYDEGKHPRITVDAGAKLEALCGFYRDVGSSRAELVLDNGTAVLSGGEFVETSGGSSGTITLRNGALLDADMDITLNSDWRANTISNSTVNLHARVLAVENGARLEISGGSFRTGKLSVGPSRIEFGGGATAELEQIGLSPSVTDGSCALVFDNATAVCAKDVDMQSNDMPLTLTFRGTNTGLRVSGDFDFGTVSENASPEQFIVFDIPQDGWDEPPLLVGGACQLTTNVTLSIPSFDWISDASNRVPLIGFSSRPEFLTDEWLASAGRNAGLPSDCTLKYDETAQVLSVEYVYNPDGTPLCEINGVLFSNVEKAFGAAKPGETVRLITAARAGELHIPDFVTLDLNGFLLGRYGAEDYDLPEIRENGGVLVAYGTTEVNELFGNTFVGTMRFGRDVVWNDPDGDGSVTFPQGTDVTVGTGSGKTDVYLVTTTFIDTYGLPDDWAVDVYGSTELGGLNYRKCSLEVAEDAHIVAPMKLVDSTLAVSGTVSFAEGAYIEFGCLTNGGIYARSQIDVRSLRFYDPLRADVTCTELPDGTYWYHPCEAANVELVAEVDGEEFASLQVAFDKAGKDKPVRLLRDYVGTSEETFTVPRSFTLDLNDYSLMSSKGISITVTNGVSLTVVGRYHNSVCSNVFFSVDGKGSSPSALHLVGGRYYGSDIAEIWTGGMCQIDHGAVLEGSSPVSMRGGTLVMTDATLHATTVGISCYWGGVTNVLRIGAEAKVISDDFPAIDSTDGMVALDISGNCEFHATNTEAGVIFAESVKPDQAGVSGGRFYGARPDDKCLAKGYSWAKRVTESEGPYWMPRKNPDFVEVNGVLYDNLEEAFAAASKSGRPVKLVTDYTYGGGPLSVSKSFALELNNHVFAPYARLDISIVGGATFGLNGHSVCSNVHFVVGNEDGSATGALHLAGGRYYGGVADEIVTIGRGTCLIDGEANLEGKRPVGMYGGTLAMTNATIHGTEYGIYAAKGSVPQTNTLRIGKDAKVSSDEYSPLFLSESDVDLDISGSCEFRPRLSNVRAIEGGRVKSGPGITGGSFYGAQPSTEYLNLLIYEGWKHLVDAASEPYWAPKERMDVAKVGRKAFKSLEEAFDAANTSGKNVQLVADYTGDGGLLSVSNSYALELNNHILAPSSTLEITIVGGASFDLDGLYDIAVCSNVHFIVEGESGRSEGALHLVGGQYYGGDSEEIVTVRHGMCQIDYGAILEATCPVCMTGGTLEMSEATIRGSEYGIYATSVAGSQANILRIRDGVKVSSDGNLPLSLSGMVNLDISGDCEFRPKSDGIPAIIARGFVPDQAGVSGGRFYGARPDDKYLAKGYVWENEGSESAPCWTPKKVVPPQPTASDGIRIEGGKVFSGDYEITDAVTVRGDGSVELNPGGRVGGVRVTPVIGDLPPGDGDETDPFVVGEGSVSLTIQTIPGLTYVLLRGETPDKVEKPVASSMATKNVTTLEDFAKPKDGAFYRIKVVLEFKD